MESSVSFLLENLRDVVVYHAKLISGAEKELKELEKDLEMMKKKLEDAAKKPKKEEAFKQWERQIQDVVYQVEDTIDDCITETASKSTLAKTFGSTTGLKLAKEVKSLREGPVKNVFDQAMVAFVNLQMSDSIDLPESDDQSIKFWRESKTSHIVGLKDETQTITNYLKEDSKIVQVISIYGMPGLGKTTLAWKLFQDPDIQYEFPIRIWVTVSETLNVKNVLLTILKHFTQEDIFSKMSYHELLPLVKEYLHKEKFLIIFDDIWTTDAWDLIKVALPMQENGMGKVLITTRINNVATYATTRPEAHNLRFLNEEESWELLQYGIYDKLEAVDEVLVNVGKLIAKNCDGLPLSIVVIAGVLREMIATTGKPNSLLIRQRWEKVARSVKDYLIDGNKEGRMAKIIALSYSKLRYDLRDCFLYMAMFPEDALIPASQLTLLWIAEGFIQSKQGYSLEEIALDYLNDLISRALVMVKKTKLTGEVKICSVHDAIREFCIKEAAYKGNLFQEVRMNEGENEFRPQLMNITKYRRISIHSYIPKFFLETPKIQARSFLCFPKDPLKLEPEEASSVNNTFLKLLRVFAAENLKFPRVPTKMTKLVHLRYLTLSLSFELKVLPPAIFSLWRLQTLIVETMSLELEINANIWKIFQLRHLKTKAAITLTCKDGNGQGGKRLKTLSRLSPESCTDSVFEKAENLLALGVRGDLSKLLKLNKLEHLKNLKLEHDANKQPLISLPEEKQFPRSIKILTLKGTRLKWNEMSTVGSLVNLEVLKLKDRAFMGDEWEVVDDGFCQLEFMYIEHTNLISWKVNVRSFPKLKSLTLKSCELLKEVPLVLGKTLEMLDLERVTRLAVISATKIEEEKLKDPSSKRFKLDIAPADKIPK